MKLQWNFIFFIHVGFQFFDEICICFHFNFDTFTVLNDKSLVYLNCIVILNIFSVCQNRPVEVSTNISQSMKQALKVQNIYRIWN